MSNKLKRQRTVVRGAHRMAAIAAGVVLTLGVASSAHADSAPATGADWSNMFSFSGFGTVGMTHSSLGTADYTTNFFQPKGAGASSQYDFSDDTKVGAQVNAQLTSQLSAVVQIIMQQRYDNSYAPTVEWANIKYAITPDLDVRVGRIALPTFLASDYVNVGYASPWAHAPIEVYNLVPVDSSDGVDTSYTLHLGKIDNTVQMFYGVDNTRAPNPFAAGDVKFNARNIFGVFDTVERGALTVRAGYMQAKLNYGPFMAEPVTFYTAGAAYDQGNWFVQGEWAHAKVGNLTPGYNSWYAVGGYRIQKFTPYVMYSMERSLANPIVIPNGNQGQKDYSVGVRWDLRKNLDLKVQYDRVVLPNNSQGYFVNPQQGFVLGSRANVVSAVLDFVF